MPWVQPDCLAGGAHGRTKQPAKMIVHSVQIGFVHVLWPAATYATGVTILSKKVPAFSAGHGLVAKNVSVCRNALDAAYK